MSLNSVEKLKLMGSTSVENNAVSQTSNLNAESIFNNSNVTNSQSDISDPFALSENFAINISNVSTKTTQNCQNDEDTGTVSLRQELEQTKKDQGIVSKAWDGIKNLFGAKNSSSNVEKTIEKFENGEISEEEARQALDEYKNAQSTFKEKLSGIISTAGLIGTVAGAVLSFIPGGQVIGLPLLAISGKVALGGMFVDNALDLVDNSTDKDGLTKDELKDLAIETGVEAAAYVAGRGIGKLTGNMHTNISNKLIEKGTNKVASKAIGYAGEALADGALSLSADYGIAQTQSLITTGKTVAWKDYWSWDRFKSEGRSQLIGILTGVATSKQYSSGTIAPSATGAKVASDGADVVSTKGVDGDVTIAASAETKTGELVFNPETGELRRVKSSNKTKAEKLSQAEAGCNVGVELRPETTGAKIASDGADVVSTKGVDGGVAAKKSVELEAQIKIKQEGIATQRAEDAQAEYNKPFEDALSHKSAKESAKVFNEIYNEVDLRIAEQQQIARAQHVQDDLIDAMRHPSGKSAQESAEIFKSLSPNSQDYNEKIEFCQRIISEFSQKEFALPSGSKFKVKNQITSPEELYQALEAMSTPYDTEEIVIQRARNLVAGQLNVKNNGSIKGLRKEIKLAEILDSASLQIKNALKEKKLFIITGNTASGKSTYCTTNNLTSDNGYFVVDSDEIKKLLPGYDEFGANFTHGVSASVARAELEIAIEEGANIVYPTTGTAETIIELANEYGYTIEIRHCDLPYEECIKRSMNRFEEEKRFVDPYYIMKNRGIFEKVEEIGKKYGIMYSTI